MPTRQDGGSKQVVAVIDTDLCERLDEICEELERSRSWIIGKAIKAYVDQHGAGQANTSKVRQRTRK